MHVIDTHSPGANWREEAGARDTATCALGRFGAAWAKGAGRIYRWKSYDLYLSDPSGEVARIIRTERAEVELVIRGGIARRHPTAQDAIHHARVMLGLPADPECSPTTTTTQESPMTTTTKPGPDSATLLNTLGSHLAQVYRQLTYTTTPEALGVHRHGALVYLARWEPATETWRITDHLGTPHCDAAFALLDTVVEDAKRRHPVRVPAVPVITGTDDEVEALAAFGAELLRHNGGLRCGVSAVTLKGASLRVESGASCPLELALTDDGTWAARWREDEEDFEELTNAMDWLRAQTSWVTDPPASDLCELAADVSELCEELVALLDRKNKAYGDSARKPLAVFSKLPAIDRLAVRIDDKLSRIARGSESAKADVPEDTVLDLIGYLAIYLVESRKADR